MSVEANPDDFALFHVDVTLRRAAVAAEEPCRDRFCAPLDDPTKRYVSGKRERDEDDLYQGDGASSGAAGAPRGGWAVVAAAAAVIAARALR